jgi:hypothetical protein
MFAPTLSDSLGMTRRDFAIERGADALHDLLEWSPPKRTPASTGIFNTRERLESDSLTRRVLFTGKFWMADEKPAAWRPVSPNELIQSPFKPVSDLARRADAAGTALRALGQGRGALIEAGKPLPAAKKATSFDELLLEPLDAAGGDAELSTVGQLAQMELRVEVVRFTKPAANATGASTGRVLAVSENYSAQSVGGNNVVIHQNKNLDRALAAGQNVTLAYENGKASVFDGVSHDVNIVASWMPQEQQAYLRMVMLDALSMMKTPQDDDERLRDAMRYALESTANFFGASDSRLRRADIKLVVNEKVTVVKPDGADASPARPANKP